MHHTVKQSHIKRLLTSHVVQNISLRETGPISDHLQARSTVTVLRKHFFSGHQNICLNFFTAGAFMSDGYSGHLQCPLISVGG